MERGDSTCWSIVAGAAAGSASDRDSFSRQYGPLIRRYLAARWRLAADHDRVVEACHEVMIQLFKPDGALASVEPQRAGGFRAFLYGVVRNVALMLERAARRQRQVRGESSFDRDDIAGSEATLSQVFDRAWVEMLATQARRLMASRPGERRRSAYQCLELRYVEGIPPRDIATRLGCDVAQVYELLRTARTEYRTALLDVMARYHPEASREELEQKCRELTHLL